jgi:hypothetical protein
MTGATKAYPSQEPFNYPQVSPYAWGRVEGNLIFDCELCLLKFGLDGGPWPWKAGSNERLRGVSFLTSD